jgi:PAS domain S-box-containing protein
VLLVEDSETDALLLERELRKGGYDPVCHRVETAADLRSSLAAEPWDVVLADYCLPALPAPLALELVKQAHPDAPFIIVSGTIDEETAVEALRSGASDFITKRRLTRLVPAVERELRDVEVRRERVRARARLRDSEATLRSFYNAVPALMGIVELTDDDDIRHVYDNPAAERFFGLTPGHTGGRTASELGVPEEVRQLWLAAYRESGRTRSPRSFEYLHGASSGDPRWMWVSVARIDGTRSASPRYCYVAEDVTDRKTFEEELARRERRFRSLIEDSSDMVSVLDADGRILFASPAIEKQLGHPPDSLRATSVFERIHPADVPMVRSLFQRMLVEPAGHHQGTMRYRHANGEWRVLEVTAANLLADSAVAGIVVNSRDVTDRALAEAALRESEERYRRLVDLLPVGVVLADAGGRLVSANAAALRILGTDELNVASVAEYGQLQGRWAHSGEPVAADEWTLARALRGEDVVTPDEFEYTGFDGVERNIMAHGIPIRGRADEITGAVVTLIDMTQLRRMQQTLVESERRFRSLIEHSADMVQLLDADGTVRYQSPSVQRMLGYDAQELLGRNAFDLIHPADQARVMRGFRELVERADGSWTVEYRMRARPEGWRTLQVEARNRLEDPAVRGVVVNARDLTDAKNLEEQLRQSQKMEAIGRLAGGVAHDFNNVLTAIQGHAGFLLESIPPGDPLREDVDEVARSADRAADLTRQLLAFSRRQLTQPVVLDLRETVTGMQRMLRRILSEDIEVRIEAGGEPCIVHADRGHLEQVILNLAVNAGDAMPQGGRLELRTSVERQPVRFGQLLRRGPERAVLTVTDTGSGIEAETLPRIFEPFFTTKGPGRGTGLGLAMVYGIVQQAGGEIQVESQPGAGSTFRVLLPLAEGKPHSEDMTVAAPGRIVGTETILLVEDEDAVRSLSRRSLERHGFQVTEARNGSEALQVFEQDGEGIDLVVTDVVMPLLNGRELAERIRAVQPGMRILFVSGYTEDEVFRRGIAAEQVPFLQKPFTPSQLVRSVRSLLDAGPAPSADGVAGSGSPAGTPG